MDYFSIVVPEAGTNLIRNPSFENNVTDNWGFYAGSGNGGGGVGTRTRSFTHSRYGFASCRMKADTMSASYIYSSPVYSLPNGSSVTAGVSFYGWAAYGRMRIWDNTTGVIRATINPTKDNQWERLTVSWTNTTGSAADVRIECMNLATDGSLLQYYDGAQLEALSYATTYMDGDQDGCRWAGKEHASENTRLVTTRSGGREINLTTYNVNCTMAAGIGMPPLEHNLQEQAIQIDALVGSVTVRNRPILLSLYAKGSDLNGLHTIRKNLIEAIKPDKVGGNQPLILKYSPPGSSSKTLYIKCLYEAGLELSSMEALLERFSLRLLSTSPLWIDDAQGTSELTGSQTLSNSNYILARQNKQWGPLSTGTSGVVYSLTLAPDGTLYAGGLFVTAGGITVNNIAMWDGHSWAALGTGTNGAVWSLAVSITGDLYAAGAFTTAGGVTVNRIAKWNGSTWSALGTGLNAVAYTVSISDAGLVYVGGDFTTAGGVTANRIATWNGATWAEEGLGANGTVSATVVDNAGNLYVGGNFTQVSAGGTGGQVGVVSTTLKASYSTYQGSGSTATWTGITVSAGQSLVVTFSGGGPTGGNISSVKWNTSENFTRAIRIQLYLDPYAEIWYLAVPTATTADVVVTLSGTYTAAAGVLYVLNNVNTTPMILDSQSTNNSDSPGVSASLTLNSTANSRIIGVLSRQDDYDGNLQAGPGQTARQYATNSIADILTMTSDELGAAGTTVHSYSWDRSRTYAMCAVSINGGTIVTAAYIAKWNGTNWNTLDGGTNGIVYGLSVDRNDLLYACGDFTVVGSASLAANRIATWDGSSWDLLSSGMNGTVKSMWIDDVNDLLYAIGTFTTAGGYWAAQLAVWNGSRWLHYDAALPSPTIYAMVVRENGDIIIGGNSSGTVYASGYTTVANGGTAESYPIMRIAGPAILRFVENQTTDDKLYLAMTISSGEIVEFVFTPGEKAITSTWEGSRMDELMSPSNFATFSLLPGNNVIAVYATGTTANTKISLIWPNKYWSADGSA